MAKRKISSFFVVLPLSFFLSGSADARLQKPVPQPFDILHYKIDLTLNEKDLSYKAKTDIHFQSRVEGLKEVTLHYKNGVQKKTLPMPLRKGESISMTVTSEGKADERSQDGLFTVRPNPNDLPQFYTQFESQGARNVFPCYDEPFDKATTEVTITANEKYTLLSNGEKISEEKLPGGLKRVHFKNNDPISTYHITFVAATLEPLTAAYSSKFGKKIPLAIYAPPGSAADVRYAMEALKKSLAFYEDYFGMAYPWDSYGIVAVTGFMWGGMENKGLANLNAARLLWNSKTHPLYKKAQIVGLVAHELAHEWFGNMVTMTWWDDLWLNEAFATFMTSKVEAALFGEDYAAVDDYRWLSTSYFPQDQGALSHPIVPDYVDTLDELFDSVTYAKGVQVVNMLEDLIGADKFQEGIRNYFAAHRLGNASTKDFLGAMEKASGRRLDGFARAWLHGRGFPKLVLSGNWEESKKVFQLQVTQKNPPFEFRMTAGGDPLHITQPVQHFEIPWPHQTRIIPVNAGGKALVQYEWSDSSSVKSEVLKPLEDEDPYVRFESAHHFLTGPFVTAHFKKEGTIPESLRAVLVARLNDKSKAVAWGTSWALIDNRLSPDFAKALARSLWEEAKKLYERLPKNDPVVAQLRQQLLTLLGQADVPQLYDFLAKQAESGLFDDKLGALAGLLRSRSSNRYVVFEETLRRYREVHHAKLEILRALAVTPRPEVLAKVNQYLFDETLVAKDDSTIPIRVWRTVNSDNRGIVYSKEGIVAVAEFVQKNLDRGTVAAEALRGLEGASTASAELKRQIQIAMTDLLKQNPSGYVKSLSRKILAASK